MGSFNSFASKGAISGNTVPVWLGVVSPLPVGGVLAAAWAKAGAYVPAGTPINIANGVITPFVTFKVTASTAGTDVHTLTVKPSIAGYKLTTADFVQVVGSTFAATGKASAISAITEADGVQTITVTDANIDATAVGTILALSSATAAGSSKALAAQPNAYLYNDICIDANADANIAASGAAVVAHNEGILIDRTAAASVKAQMAAAVPNVIQVNN